MLIRLNSMLIADCMERCGLSKIAAFRAKFKEVNHREIAAGLVSELKKTFDAETAQGVDAVFRHVLGGYIPNSIYLCSEDQRGADSHIPIALLSDADAIKKIKLKLMGEFSKKLYALRFLHLTSRGSAGALKTLEKRIQKVRAQSPVVRLFLVCEEKDKGRVIPHMDETRKLFSDVSPFVKDYIVTTSKPALSLDIFRADNDVIISWPQIFDCHFGIHVRCAEIAERIERWCESHLIENKIALEYGEWMRRTPRGVKRGRS